MPVTEATAAGRRRWPWRQRRQWLGGGIYNAGSLDINKTTFTANAALGGAGGAGGPAGAAAPAAPPECRARAGPASAAAASPPPLLPACAGVNGVSGATGASGASGASGIGLGGGIFNAAGGVLDVKNSDFSQDRANLGNDIYNASSVPGPDQAHGHLGRLRGR